MKSLIVLLSFLGFGCAASTVPPDSIGVFQPADDLETRVSLFPGDAAVLSDEQISSVLNSRAQLPQSIKLAVVHLRHSSAARFWGWGSILDADTRQQLAGELLSSVASSRRVRTAAFLPTFLLPEVPSVGHLREAAARFQADGVLVYETECEIFRRARFFRAANAKATCRVESALLDVRTGIVPFAAELLEGFEVSPNESDANFQETIRRAETLALESALRKTGAKATAWLSEDE